MLVGGLTQKEMGCNSGERKQRQREKEGQKKRLRLDTEAAVNVEDKDLPQTLWWLAPVQCYLDRVTMKMLNQRCHNSNEDNQQNIHTNGYAL